MAIVCITNDMRDVRSCVRHKLHTDACDGWEYVYNQETQRDEASGKPCRGCLPREARHGLLCEVCYERLGDALNGVGPWLTAMQGVENAVRRDTGGVRTKSGPPIPISPVQLAVDEVMSWYRYYPGDIDAWSQNYEGAKQAVHFARVTLSAVRSHEAEEKPHRIKRVRCEECGQTSLVWTPPGQFRAPVNVQCQNADCRHGLTQDQFEEAELATPRRTA